jgi:mRNA interferase MazF
MSIINISNLILLPSINYNGKIFNVDEKMIKRGELYYADLSPVVGSEQGGVRPILIVQNDTGNKYSPTIIAAAVTSKLTKAKLPTHIELSGREYGLSKDSVILLEQIRTLDKRRLKERIGELPSTTMRKVNTALLISLGFGDNLQSTSN